jgi:hypothetical protein
MENIKNIIVDRFIKILRTKEPSHCELINTKGSNMLKISNLIDLWQYFTLNNHQYQRIYNNLKTILGAFDHEFTVDEVNMPEVPDRLDYCREYLESNKSISDLYYVHLNTFKHMYIIYIKGEKELFVGFHDDQIWINKFSEFYENNQFDLLHQLFNHSPFWHFKLQASQVDDVISSLLSRHNYNSDNCMCLFVFDLINEKMKSK